jgi:hypothetical protein
MNFIKYKLGFSVISPLHDLKEPITVNCFHSISNFISTTLHFYYNIEYMVYNNIILFFAKIKKYVYIMV